MINPTASRKRWTYIHFGSVRATTACSHFWGNVNGSANTSGHIACVHVGGSLIHSKLPAGGQAKISNLDIFNTIWAGANEDVLRL